MRERYTVLDAGDGQVGGIMALPAEAGETGLRPCWMGYIGVGDVDVVADQVPGGGWIIQATDPQGAMFALVGPHAS